MATLVKIKNVREQREKYLFQVTHRKQATDETDARVKRVAVEIARYLAGQMAELEQTKEA